MKNWDDFYRDMGIKPFQVLQTDAFLHNMKAVDLEQHPPTEEALRLVPEEIARRHTVVPVTCQHNVKGTDVLVIALMDPADITPLDELKQANPGWNVTPVLAARDQILEAIERCYGRE